MKALVYHGPGSKAWEDVPDATIADPTDVVVRVETTTICGTDLHILHGDVEAVTDGRILGHEAVGTVTEVGAAVTGFAPGDRVLVPAISRCGRCAYCQRGMPSHCQTLGGIGWIFGHLVDGTQAEAVRVPYADTSLYRIPEVSPTSRRSSSPTRCPPTTRSVCWPATCGPGTRWRSSAPGPSGSRRCSRRGCGVPHE
jgi:alcohol dehydrogenase